jgi:hypothetical protein
MLPLLGGSRKAYVLFQPELLLRLNISWTIGNEGIGRNNRKQKGEKPAVRVRPKKYMWSLKYTILLLISFLNFSFHFHFLGFCANIILNLFSKEKRIRTITNKKRVLCFLDRIMRCSSTSQC